MERVGLPRELILSLKDRFGLRLFVECGTYRGDTAVWAASHFERVITIEASKEIYETTSAKHGKIGNIKFLYGDSRTVLPTILPSLVEPTIKRYHNAIKSALKPKRQRIVEVSPDEKDAIALIRSSGLLSEGKPLRLHLGCGEGHFDGYINIDYPPSDHTVQRKSGADIFADIMMLQFPEQVVDEIRLHHVFEHFKRARALALCIKWHEWLKVGGILHIETPDLMGSTRQLCSDLPYKTKQAIVRHLFGSHEAHWAYHYDGWYAEKFQLVLSQFGFSVVCRSWRWAQEPYLSNVEAVATKKRHCSRQQLLHAADS